ncbi:MAG: potassium channel family protein [Acidobacteriota bacterium]|nr:potassium channel family protein [Acidobacteriota bacterium]
MHLFAFIAGLVCCLGVALDAFQTIVLPRRPTGRFRITRLFFVATWKPWVLLAERSGKKKVREQIYSIYGPLSLLLLLLLWALLLIFGFALIYFSMHSAFGDAMLEHNAGALAEFGTDLYVSGTTLFTLGLGDVVPHRLPARAIVIAESGSGLGFVALVIGYLPVLYQAFSHREVSVALLDARAGSPPNAAELLRRHAFEDGHEALNALMAEWERWAAQILESHISYPILCYYRSQHDNQSWLSALVAILDTCALLISVVEGTPSRQAQLTFVMARHALIDLGHVFQIEESPSWARGNEVDRLPPSEFNRLCQSLGENHLRLCGDPASARRLNTIRALYEPHAYALSDYLRMPLPVWAAPPKLNDQWSVLSRLRTDAEAAIKGADGRPSFSHDEEHPA